jgi:hypothetical protein
MAHPSTSSSSSSGGQPLELIRCEAATGKFQVGEAALDVLRRLKGPVSVVAVCGRARQVSRVVAAVQRRGGLITRSTAPTHARPTSAAVETVCGCSADRGPLRSSLTCKRPLSARLPPPPRPQGKSFILNQLLEVTGGFQIGSTTRPCTKVRAWPPCAWPSACAPNSEHTCYGSSCSKSHVSVCRALHLALSHHRAHTCGHPPHHHRACGCGPRRSGGWTTPARSITRCDERPSNLNA